MQEKKTSPEPSFAVLPLSVDGFLFHPFLCVVSIGLFLICMFLSKWHFANLVDTTIASFTPLLSWLKQLKTGVQDYYIRTRVQGDLGSVHVAQPVGKPDVKDKTCFNCGKKGHLAENCPEPKKCSHCGKKGHLAKDCWEKHPDKKPTAKPKAKGQPTKPGGRGKGRGKGGRKTKGRRRGNKFRNVEGEEEDEEQDEDYEDEGEPESDDVEHPEPEGEDPSGSVNQINQMTMCVRGKPVTVATSSSSTERVCSEQHRVDEINLSEKFQSIGVGDPKRRWLVDSGATCQSQIKDPIGNKHQRGPGM